MKDSHQWMKVQLVNEYGNYADIRIRIKTLVYKKIVKNEILTSNIT